MSLSTVCFTCAESMQQNAAIAIRDNEKVQDALAKHFWFTADETQAAVLCQQCWSKIDEFHKFYSEVERVHVRQLQPIQWLNVKIEPSEQVSASAETYEHNLQNSPETADTKTCMKIETDLDISDDQHGDYNEDDDDYDAMPAYSDNEGSTNINDVSDSNETIQKRKKPARIRKRPPQPVSDQFIAEHVNLECDTCSLKFISFTDLQKHSTEQHGKLAYVFCCDFKFCRKPRLIDHLLYHLNPNQFQCDICSRQLQSRESLKRHMASAHAQEDGTIIKCSFCPKTFRRIKILHIHEKYHRKLREKKWHCATCDKYFAYESQLNYHNQRKHQANTEQELKYVCHICAKGFQTLVSYTMHVESHNENFKRVKQPSEVERVQCAECGVWLFRKGLRNHMMRHTGSRTCEYCGQECKSVMSLQYHRAQHQKADIVCSVCGKVFKQQISLKEHMTSHTGEVLYRCDFCAKTFNSKANRAAHRKKMHPKEWLEEKLRKNPNLAVEQGDLLRKQFMNPGV
ncbi:transcription factor grauzone-like [Malaya genurostris]|uniref:transcription factor grauzone-like n=1 Tax=Malaya genurostris TaxID=325434 RepID=UPI0026F3EEFE|nr:transcription factor grauzone-like [Malaya genurostris]